MSKATKKNPNGDRLASDRPALKGGVGKSKLVLDFRRMVTKHA